MVKIFAIGATGYVGSDAVAHIAQAQPEHTWTFLVRNPSKAALISPLFPADTTRFVTGDFSSHNVIAAESAAADVVINWGSSDDVPLVNSILAGIRKKTSPAFLIHVSGTAILEWADITANRYGEHTDKVYDDWDGVREVTTGFPDEALHRPVDRIVLEAAADPAANVRAAIVCPPFIYGPSRVAGVHENSALAWTVDAVLKYGRGFRVGAGRARWSTVHLHDLSELFARLVADAAKGGGFATWGPDAYYFAEDGEVVWGDFTGQIARVAAEKGLVSSAEVDQLDAEQAKKVHPYGLILWGYNARSKAVRARKLFGWTPVRPSMLDDMEQNWRWDRSANDSAA